MSSIYAPVTRVVRAPATRTGLCLLPGTNIRGSGQPHLAVRSLRRRVVTCLASRYPMTKVAVSRQVSRQGWERRSQVMAESATSLPRATSLSLPGPLSLWWVLTCLVPFPPFPSTPLANNPLHCRYIPSLVVVSPMGDLTTVEFSLSSQKCGSIPWSCPCPQWSVWSNAITDPPVPRASPTVGTLPACPGTNNAPSILYTTLITLSVSLLRCLPGWW